MSARNQEDLCSSILVCPNICKINCPTVQSITLLDKLTAKKFPTIKELNYGCQKNIHLDPLLGHLNPIRILTP
jgi:hypothetical protein